MSDVEICNKVIVKKKFRFKLKPKPISINNLILLLKIPYVSLRELCLYLDSYSYLMLLATCKDIRKLKNDNNLISNNIFDIITILDLIYNQKRNVFIFILYF
jgi:hypothetical protein